ncbi:MAG: hypothetical protein RSB55_00875 [Oscillospiraceae bacterium]
MTGLCRIREAMVTFLKGAGLDALSAWSPTERKKLTGAVVAVSLRGCESTTGGFRDYLGERENKNTGLWEELYGKRVALSFGLDVYCPREGGGGALQEVYDKLAGALQTAAPAGLTVLSLSRGAAGFQEETGLLLCPMEAQCSAYLYAVADEGGQFADFEVKGVQT